MIRRAVDRDEATHGVPEQIEAGNAEVIR